MIQYALKCTAGHRFDSWFSSAADFDRLQASGLLTCAVCGDASVQKELMAPTVRAARSASNPVPRAPDQDPERHPQTGRSPGPLSAPASPAEQMIAELRKKVESSSEYVGTSFAAQARAMHNGDAPVKSIYGEADAGEARKLLEDGVPVLPLPFRPSGKSN